MKCFAHPQMDAVGNCKHCFKGICAQCAKDTGIGIVCSEPCEVEVKSIHALVQRNRKMHAFAPKTYLRSAYLFLILVAAFITFGIISDSKFLSAYLTVFGVAMLCGAAFAFYNNRKIAKAVSE